MTALKLSHFTASMVLSGLLITPNAIAKAPPKLVLQITVDQFRGDLPARYRHRMGSEGINYLLDNGVEFNDAHHWHANTETVVGHATLATGAYPSGHGMIGNAWIERSSGELVYNVEDREHTLLSADAALKGKDEIDPSQRAARGTGRSPVNMKASTLADEIKIRNGEKSKVFAVSVKDRGAIPMAGQSGQAYWFSKKNGEFVTSTYYQDQYPDWVLAWNGLDLADQYAEKPWQLLKAAGEYHYANQDDMEWETDFPGLGRTFPHNFGAVSDKYFYTRLTLSPAGDELTLDFAKTLINKEQIGQDEITDYLSVSFSSTDYVGHIFGPSSLEMEDNLLRLDRTLGKLLRYVDKEVGLENTLVVLSADHGAPDPAGYLQHIGVHGQIADAKSWDTAETDKQLKGMLGVGKEVIAKYYPPYIYLDEQVMSKHEILPKKAQQAVARVFRGVAGVADALPAYQLEKGQITAKRVDQLVANNHDPERSGDVYVVLEPNSYINDFDGLHVAVHHGSPWRYDTFVPLIFAGYGLQPAQVDRPVKTVDLAPTVAHLVGVKAPSASEGEILTEVSRR